ncbi:histidinol-phosphatase, inositol monophosphatase family [Sulfitobacter brevis]|uniref:Histidinol-phosphatase, inositol monophosphatase family n=1 Tax=Sulfitobacter brevis TaxID=74348 RepID=A0A1I2FNP4_9RHOB|nr:inositol monophosphatase family protein [Sulfitobacter brevis]SFF06220.1 histidinol-phosphatase, inositol monophosphatase family [Sulfitobacter brevis]
MINLSDALRFSSEVADEAGRMALRYFRKPLTVELKADESPVTAVDREVEALLRSRIIQAYPDHGIYGEEEAPMNLDSPYVWVIDPIDGTKSFITGHPLFGGLMALLQGGEPCLGQIDMPATGERWSGLRGEPSTLNGSPCTTSDCRDLSAAFVYTTDPFLFAGPKKHGVFKALKEQARLIRYGGDCYNYGMLASGLCDLVVETGLEPYDYLPVVQIVRGAGGVITDWHGMPLGIGSNGDVLAAATPELHAQMLDHFHQLQANEAA